MTTTSAPPCPCLQMIVAQDGLPGLFTRGLKTRLAANGLQNMCFTVLWQQGQRVWLERHPEQPPGDMH